MRILFAAAWLLSFALASQSLAQVPPDELIAGAIGEKAVVGGTAMCASSGGPSIFRRSGVTEPAAILFPEIVFASLSNRRNAYTISGNGRLNFLNAKGGTLSFNFNADYPPEIRQPVFNAYAQTYDPATGVLTVSFNIKFPDCVLPIRAIYRN